jgi:chromosome segregation ATPase
MRLVSLAMAWIMVAVHGASIMGEEEVPGCEHCRAGKVLCEDRKRTLNSKIRVLNDGMSRLEGDIKDKSRKLEAAKSMHSSAQARLASDVHAHKSAIEKINDDLKMLETRQQDRKHELGRLKTRLQTTGPFLNERQGIDGSIRDLGKECSRLADEKTRMEGLKEGHKRRLAGLTLGHSFKDEIDTHMKQIDALEKSRRERKAEKRELESELNALSCTMCGTCQKRRGPSDK